MSVKQKREEQFVSIGDYSAPDAERLLDALTRARFKFEIECDDGIRFGASKMGRFGQFAKVRVFINRGQIPEVTKIQTSLFAE